MTQRGEELARYPEEGTGEPSPNRDPNKLSQRIQRHHQTQDTHSLNGKLLRLTRDRLPLLATLRRRWLTGGVSAWSTGADLLYARLSSAPELVSALPLAPTTASASPVTAHIGSVQPGLPRTPQTHPMAPAAGVSTLVRRAIQPARPEPIDQLPDTPATFVHRTSDTAGKEASSTDLRLASDASGTPSPISKLTPHSVVAVSAPNQPVQRTVSSGQSMLPKASREQPTSARPGKLGVAIVQRHLSQSLAKPITSTVAGAVAIHGSQPVVPVLQRRKAVAGAPSDPPTPARAAMPENRALTSAVDATAETQPSVMTTPSITPSVMPGATTLSMVTDLVGATVPAALATGAPATDTGNATSALPRQRLALSSAAHLLQAADKRTSLPVETGSGIAQPRQASGDPVLRQHQPTRAIQPDRVTRTATSGAGAAVSSPGVQPSHDLGAAIVQRHLKGRASQLVQSQAITTAAPSRPPLTALRGETGVQPNPSHVAVTPDMPHVQAAGLAASAAPLPMAQDTAGGAATAATRPVPGPIIPAVPHAVTASAPPAALPAELNAPRSAPIDTQGQVRLLATPASGVEAVSRSSAEAESRSSAEATLLPPATHRRREVGAAIVQRRPNRGAHLSTSTQATTALPTQPSPAAAPASVLRRQQPVSEAATTAGSLATAASAAVASVGGNSGAAIVQRQRQGVTAQALQRQPPTPAPTASGVTAQALQRQPPTPAPTASVDSPTAPVLRRTTLKPEIPALTHSLPAASAALPGAVGQRTMHDTSVQRSGEGSAPEQAMVTPALSVPAAADQVEPILRRVEHPPTAGSALPIASHTRPQAAEAMLVQATPSVVVSATDSSANRTVPLVQPHPGKAVGQAAQLSATPSGIEQPAPHGAAVLRANRSADSSYANPAGALPTSRTASAASRAAVTPVSGNNLAEPLAQSQSSGASAQELPRPVYAIQRRRMTPMDMENIGLTMLRRRHGGLGAPMVENGLRVVQAMTTGELPIARRSAISRNFGQRVTSPVQLAAPSSIVAFRAEEATVTPLPNAPLAPSPSMMRVPALTGVGDWPVTGPELPVARTGYASADVYQSSLPLMEGFNPLESSGGGNSTVRATLPLALPKVQAKPVDHTAAQAFQGAPAYASGAVAMPLQRSPTAPASPSAMPPPVTNSDTHKVVEQALNDVSQPNAPEIDLERLASAVYQIIERRLIRERESMGL